MSRAAVINVSYPHYNLGCAKLANWLRGDGWDVEQFDGDPGLFIDGFDRVCVSAIFTWDVPKAAEIAHRVKSKSELWSGGPGFFRTQGYWFAQTGTNSILSTDPRFESQDGDYRMCFASRGCPVGCHFCIVPQMEGKTFTMYPNFKPAPILCDNNLSALPVEFQEHIIRRYVETGTRLLDANSGFEPKWFDEGTYQRWKVILKGVWRYAFDIMPEWRDVQRVSGILKDVSPRYKKVYVLVGNEPIESCYERAVKVIEWGAEPHCQYEMALDTLTKEPKVRFDWTTEKLKDFCRYFNRWGWRSYPLSAYETRGERLFENFASMKNQIHRSPEVTA